MSEHSVPSEQLLTIDTHKHKHQGLQASIENLHRSIGYLKDHESNLTQSLRDTSTPFLEQDVLSDVQYFHDLSNECDTGLRNADKAWNDLGQPENMKKSLDGCRDSLQSVQNFHTTWFDKQPLSWIPRSVATMLRSINNINKAAAELSALIPELDAQAVAFIRNKDSEVTDARWQFDRAAMSLELCRPLTEDRRSTSARQTRELKQTMKHWRTLPRWIDCAGDWEHIVRLCEAGSDIPEILDVLKKDLSCKCESSTNGWKSALSERLGEPQHIAEDYMAEAIDIGERFVSSAKSASENMRAEEWKAFANAHKIWDDHSKASKAQMDLLFLLARLPINDLEFRSKKSQWSTVFSQTRRAQRVHRDLEKISHTFQ